MVKTLSELKSASDRELVEMQKEALGHTGKEFPDTFGTEFSYSAITQELGNRGFVQGWFKPSSEITVKLDDKNERRNMTMCSDTAQRWDKLCKGSTQKNLLLSAALEHFMDDYASGAVKVRVEL